MQPLPLRVIKLGGSLLSFHDLRKQFYAWLDTQALARNLIVVGGGEAVETIRELDAIHRFPSTLTHWICVDLMSVNATLASELLGVGKPLATMEELSEFLSRSNTASLAACVQPTAYYTTSIAEQKKCNLPESWECTSDSIAAWLACSLAADQLVLLKSIESEYAMTSSLSAAAIQALAELGAVDPIFPEACKPLPDVRIVNLRSTAD